MCSSSTVLILLIMTLMAQEAIIILMTMDLGSEQKKIVPVGIYEHKMANEICCVIGLFHP